MESAILKTLIYANLFDYPLKAWEIHKWLIGKKATLKQVERALSKLIQKAKIKSQKGYFSLRNREEIIIKRENRERQSVKYLRIAKLIGYLFKLVPWVKLVGISGNLAMKNATAKDDIDFFIITSKNRIWISRLILLILLLIVGKRRKRTDLKKQAAGKICINILLEEDNLGQQNKDIYIAHEVLQMVPLWDRDGIYAKFLEENSWAFKYLPNWATTEVSGIKYYVLWKNKTKKIHNTGYIIQNTLHLVERFTKWLQLKYMGKPKGLEKITEHALYFHPLNYRLGILKRYREKLKTLAPLDKVC